MTEPTSTLAERRAADSGVSALIWILVVGAALRFAVWAGMGDDTLRIFDERDYNAIAVNLALRSEFAFTAGELTSLRPPLYPALVAVAYKAFGVESFQPIHLAQAILSLLSVVVVYRIALAIYDRDRRIALLAAAAMCFYPSLLAYNNLLLTEVLFTFLLLSGCWALIRATQTRSLGLIAAGAVLLGLGALTRSVLWPTFVPLSIWLFFAWGGPARGRWTAIAVFLALFAATLAPWTVRNTRLERTFQTVDCMSGRNFMTGNYEHTPLYRSWAAIELKDERNWFRVLTKAHPEAAEATQGQVDKLALRAGLEFAKDHPGLTLRRGVAKFFDFWGLERETVAGAARGHYGRLPSLVIWLLTLIIFSSYVCALWAGLFGAIMTPPRDRAAHALFLLLIGLVCAAHSAAFGHSRYHLPLIPLILIYASAAIVERRDIWSRRRRGSFWLASGLCLLFAVGWIAGMIGADFDRFAGLLKLTS